MSAKPAEARPATAPRPSAAATKSRPSVQDPGLRIANPQAAGIDVHAREHWVCVPDEENELRPLFFSARFRSPTGPTQVTGWEAEGFTQSHHFSVFPLNAQRSCPYSLRPGDNPPFAGWSERIASPTSVLNPRSTS
jgi:hypothetical protein